jgi:hypothetical protein
VSQFVLTEVSTWAGSHDFTCDLNSLSFNLAADGQENTTFCAGGWRTRKGGLKTVTVDMEGYWQAGDSQVDPAVFNTLGAGGEAVTVTPTGAAGSVAYMAQMGKFSYEMFGELGEMAPFTVSMMGTSTAGVARGQVVAARQTVDATGAVGSELQLGAISSTQHLYATVHVFGAGTDITLIIESDADDTFSSATTRATIGPLTAAGGTWVTPVAGSITDTWWRVVVDDIDGEFDIAVALAIQ